MKSPKEDYEIRKRVALDSGIREDLIIFLSFYTVVIYNVFRYRSNECTSKTFNFEVFQSFDFTALLTYAFFMFILAL